MAIKVVQAKDKALLRKLHHECELLKTLNHPNIVKYYGCVMKENEAEIYMELMPHTLASSYKQFGAMNEILLRKHTKQILSALNYLHTHERKIIHGDLKAANILFDGQNAKLTDFGDSRIMGSHIPNLSVSHSGVTFKDIKGSILWMAPEIIREMPVGTRSDIFSLGQLMIELASAQHPWPNIKDLAGLFENLV
jgi:mitogen-activated protein kinase kinase kinase